MFIKHGDTQSIINIIDSNDIIDDIAKDSLEKTKKIAKEEKIQPNNDLKKDKI